MASDQEGETCVKKFDLTKPTKCPFKYFTSESIPHKFKKRPTYAQTEFKREYDSASFVAKIREEKYVLKKMIDNDFDNLDAWNTTQYFCGHLVSLVDFYLGRLMDKKQLIKDLCGDDSGENIPKIIDVTSNNYFLTRKGPKIAATQRGVEEVKE